MSDGAWLFVTGLTCGVAVAIGLAWLAQSLRELGRTPLFNRPDPSGHPEAVELEEALDREHKALMKSQAETQTVREWHASALKQIKDMEQQLVEAMTKTKAKRKRARKKR